MTQKKVTILTPALGAVFVLLAGIVFLIGMVIYSGFRCYRLVQTCEQVQDESLHIKNEVLLARLGFEQSLYHNGLTDQVAKEQTFADVEKAYSQAISLKSSVDGLLAFPLAESNRQGLCQNFEVLISQIDAFQSELKQLYTQLDAQCPEQEAEVQLDSLMAEILDTAGQLNTLSHQCHKRQLAGLSHHKIVYSTVGIIFLLIAVILIYFIVSQSKRRQMYLLNGNQRLEAVEQELRTANERLRANKAELVHSNYLFQLVIDSIPVRVFWKDKDLNYLGCNALFAKDAGLQSPEDIVGKDDFHLNWPQQAEIYRSDDKEVIQSGQAKSGYEEPQNSADGRYLSLRTTKVPLRDNDGQIIGLLGTYQEISEIKKAEMDRERLFKVLEIKNKELENLVYIVSHDVRGPLLNIKGYSSELKDTLAQLHEIVDSNVVDDAVKQRVRELYDDELSPFMHYILSGTDKIEILVSGLLKLSRLGRTDVVNEPVVMNTLIEQIQDTMQYQIKEHDATISVETLPDCYGDKNQLNQVFSNLLDNALKYCFPDRAVKVHISGKIEGDRVVYAVQDNGIGIDAKDQEKVFEIFHRIDPCHKSEGEGLGLSIIRRVLERIDGTIRVESQPGLGSTFYVTLPKA